MCTSAHFAFGNMSSQTFKLVNFPIAVLRFGEIFRSKVQLGEFPKCTFLRGNHCPSEKIDLVEFCARRIFDLVKFCQIRDNRTWGGARPGPVLRRRTGYGSGADIRPLRRGTGYGSRADIRQGGSTCQIGFGSGYSRFDLWPLLGAV